MAMAIMSVREGLEFETTLETDSASHERPWLIALLDVGGERGALRCETRREAGWPAAMNEIAEKAQRQIGVRLDESAIPLHEEVRGGLRDPGALTRCTWPTRESLPGPCRSGPRHAEPIR